MITWSHDQDRLPSSPETLDDVMVSLGGVGERVLGADDRTQPTGLHAGVEERRALPVLLLREHTHKNTYVKHPERRDEPECRDEPERRDDSCGAGASYRRGGVEDDSDDAALLRHGISGVDLDGASAADDLKERERDGVSHVGVQRPLEAVGGAAPQSFRHLGVVLEKHPEAKRDGRVRTGGRKEPVRTLCFQSNSKGLKIQSTNFTS